MVTKSPFVQRSGYALTLIALAFTLFFSGCESALNDLEITDPSLLQTHFVVERSLLSDGTVVSALSTTILDKNLAGVELKNGHVKVNGQQMSTANLLGLTIYHIPSATVNLNTDYNFEVILANGQSHTGTVKSQAKTFSSVTAPATSNANTDLTISWQDIYVHDDLIISLNFTTPSGVVAGPTIELTDTQMQAGTFTIPKSNFAGTPNITSVTITLTGAKYGTIDSKFRSGSATISRMRVEKKVTFN